MEKIKKWFENFWYYHKWHFICWFLVALAFILCVAQCASVEKYDYNIIMFTYTEHLDEQKEKMADYIAQFGEDIDGDGKVTVGFTDCSYNKASTPLKLAEAKISRLQSTLISQPEKILFLTDENSFEYLNGLFDSVLFADIGLSGNDGKSVIFGEEFYNSTIILDDVTLPKGFRLSRRGETETIKYDATLLEQADNLLKKLDQNEK